MKRFSTFLATTFVLISYSLYAAPHTAVQQLIDNKVWSFVENKGQLIDSKGNGIPNVKYYSHDKNLKIYCKPGVLSFIFTKVEDRGSMSEAKNISGLVHQSLDRFSDKQLSAINISSCRMDMVLVGSNLNARIVATDQQSYFENFYTSGDANQGFTNIHTFKTITYKDIYPNIDMILNTKNGQVMEYSFLVHSGGKISDIKLSWKGADKTEFLNDGGMRYYNVLGNMEEGTPSSFSNGKQIESSFSKKGSIFGFKVAKYNHKNDLLIDPTLVWATYYGGSGEDAGLGVATDASGDAYITGYTGSVSGIATSGAYLTSYGGSYKTFLAKFDSKGNLAWSTYYGGNSTDEASAISIDASGSIYITGTTGSSVGIATSGAYQTSLAGGLYDAFLAKFNPNGGLTWATYYGGSSDDNAYGVNVDPSGNIYIVGQTISFDGIATSGAYQTFLTDSSNTSTDDAFLAKFNSSGNILWATYYGGNSTVKLALCYAWNVFADMEGNVYMSGLTTCSGGIATSGAYQTSYAGGVSGLGSQPIDAFLAKFSSSGARIWATYFGGPGNEYADGLCTDALGNVYISGMTGSDSGIATVGAFQTAYSGDSDAFIAKFNSSGGILWATYYGGNGFDIGNNVCTDASGNVYLAGTSSSSGIATSDGYQTSSGGNGNAFLAQFNSSGARLWATYYGGNNGAGQHGLSIDGQGDLYLLGGTSSTTGIATSGSYQTSFAGGGDAYLVKFNVPQSGIYPNSNLANIDLTIYPNPFTDKALIRFNLPESAHVNICLMDVQGKIVSTLSDKTFTSGENEVVFSSSDLGIRTGTYFINLTINGQLMNSKIIEVK